MDWLKIGGLALNNLGTLMVFWFAVPNRVKGLTGTFLLVDEPTEAERKKAVRSSALGWVGLGLVIIGALMQAAA